MLPLHWKIIETTNYKTRKHKSQFLVWESYNIIEVYTNNIINLSLLKPVLYYTFRLTINYDTWPPSLVKGETH